MIKYILILIVIVVVLFLVKSHELKNVIFPTSITKHSSSAKPIEVYLDGKSGRTDFSIPKAYFNNSTNMRGGRQDGLYLTVSYLEEMKPWSLSNSYLNSNDDGKLFLNIIGGYDYLYTKKLRPNWLENKFKEYDNDYLGIYEKYNSFVKFDNGVSVDFILVPKFQESNTFFIICMQRPDMTASPNCTLYGDYSEKLSYTHTVPYKEIKNARAINNAVIYLIKKLILSI